MAKGPVLEFWYEFASTYSYPAAMRVSAAAEQAGVQLAWRPFLLGPIFAAQGWETSPFNLYRAKGAYMWRDMARVCAAMNLAFNRPKVFPQNGLMAARIALALPDNGPRASFTRAVYRHQFSNGGDIADHQALATVLSELGLNAAPVFAVAQSADIKAELRKATDTAVSYGIFGAPTWRTADGEIFWGNDRLETALAWARTL